ncbi:HU family DNA-binding protein [Candidatus Mycoplasma haematominutum]|uniref:DNA-binding protein hu-alpha n=1 Tax=Candidatus Mycoplasma haematominutum 'Birmingham 1' TaxID=1116213 RepID=G8C380_9MOLU|nr:HU family DNA-binding protein [Candidatus Mycoplasma haematominutum]CCE66778.1 DNA-binding protein hu-alpha [Candidatus Mycoplasma haematominutum 'Birmingham 1']
MTKKELIGIIANKVGLDHQSVSGVLREYQYLLLTQLKQDGKATMMALGALKIATRSARSGYNPAVKTFIDIPAKEVPRFAASKKLKDFIAGDKSDIFSFEY